MAEVAGLIIGVMPLVSNIMETVKAAISVSHHEQNLSMTDIKLYVERARLGEFARVLVSNGDVDSTHDSKHDPVMLRIMTSASEKLLETQRLIERHGYKSSRYQTPNLYEELQWAHDEVRLSGLITDLKDLNDSLYSLMSLHKLQGQVKASQQHEKTTKTPIINEDSLSSTLVNDLWASCVKGLSILGDQVLKSLSLRRTFIRAAVRLTIWQDDFEFDLSDMELILGTNEYLYEAIVITFAGLLFQLWNLASSVADEEHTIPRDFRAHMGRLVEQVKFVAPQMHFSIDDIVASDNHRDYSPILDDCLTFGDDVSRSLELSIRNEINGYCSVLYDLIGAIDRAYKRHLWLVHVGQRSKDGADNLAPSVSTTAVAPFPLNDRGHTRRDSNLAEQRKSVSVVMNEILETEISGDESSKVTHVTGREPQRAAAKVPAKRLLSDNIEAATILFEHLETKSRSEDKKYKASKDPSIRKPRPRLEQEVRAELKRIKQFNQDVGTELDGDLARRNAQIQEAATFALEHLNFVLNKALTEEKLARHPSWDNIPQKRYVELEEAHPITNTASAIQEFHQINDSLDALIVPIRIAGTLPAYQLKPPSDERLVMTGFSPRTGRANTIIPQIY